MRILTGFDNPHTPKWNKLCDGLAESAERFGHKIVIGHFPINDDGEFISYPGLYHNFCWKYKIHFILHKLDTSDDDSVWIDADCLVQRELNVEEALDGCDVALTLRDIADRRKTSRPFMDGLINTGVMYFKNSLGARLFLKQVVEKMFLSIFDQDAVNDVLLADGCSLAAHGQIYTMKSGARIKILNCREHNNFYFDQSSKNARVLHFKGDHMERYKEYAGCLKSA